jgi:bifunctional DNA-binding transcriptional regulator/antitoxin component of YhaV-PrlF toxin-antitoxin module
MKTGTFIAEMDGEGKLRVPQEVRDRLRLAEGDKVEILLKKIRSKRFEVTVQKNPLLRILDLSDKKEMAIE